MRILIDASTINGGGGLEHINQLIKYNQNNEIVIISNSKITNKLRKNENISQINIGNFDKHILFIKIWYFFFIKKIINKKNYDLYLSLNGLFVPKSIKSVLFVHNLLPFDKSELKKYNYSIRNIKFKILLRVYIKNILRSNGTIFFSKHSYEIVKKNLKQEIIYRIVPHGTDNLTSIDRGRVQRKIDLNTKKKFIFLYPSSLLPYKNHYELIQAFKILIDKGYKLELNIVGEGFPYISNKIKAITSINSKYSKKIKYLGNLNKEDYQKLANFSDGIIFSSSCETFALSMFDGIRMGLPLIASDKVTAQEFLKENVFLFNPLDINNIVKNVIIFLENPIKRRQNLEKSISIINKLTWKKSIKSTFEFANSIVDN